MVRTDYSGKFTDTWWGEANSTSRLGGIPVPGRFNPHDLPNDFFRVRLVVTILETCGMFFNRGAAGKRLDIFLSLFQVRYSPISAGAVDC